MLIERQHLSPLQIAHHKMDKSLGHLNSLVVHERKKYFYNHSTSFVTNQLFLNFPYPPYGLERRFCKE